MLQPLCELMMLSLLTQLCVTRLQGVINKMTLIKLTDGNFDTSRGASSSKSIYVLCKPFSIIICIANLYAYNVYNK